MEKSEETPSCATQDNIKWLERRMDRIDERIDRINKKIRLLVRILVDKKIVGTELAKSFEETEPVAEIDKILKWYSNR